MTVSNRIIVRRLHFKGLLVKMSMNRYAIIVRNPCVIGIAARTSVANVTNSVIPKQYSLINCVQNRCFGALFPVIQSSNNYGSNVQKTLLGYAPIGSPTPVTSTSITTPVRTVTKYSRKKGKRKSVKAVIRRFYRLNWGIWIRTKVGRHRSMWKKTSARKRRLRQHVFCNATQSRLFDKMVTSYWRRPHYYVEDPYNPYHKREEFPYTRTKPQPLDS